MTQCGNPNCDRNHDVEGAVSDLASKVALEVSKAMDGDPADALYGLVQAVLSTTFAISKVGEEQEAFDMVTSFMARMTKRLLADEKLLAAKALKEAEGQAFH